jgi:hypothetical protein
MGKVLGIDDVAQGGEESSGWRSPVLDWSLRLSTSSISPQDGYRAGTNRVTTRLAIAFGQRLGIACRRLVTVVHSVLSWLVYPLHVLGTFGGLIYALLEGNAGVGAVHHLLLLHLQFAGA